MREWVVESPWLAFFLFCLVVVAVDNIVINALNLIAVVLGKAKLKDEEDG